MKLRRLLLLWALVVSGVLTGCASTPLNEIDLQAATASLGDDEAIVLVRLNYSSPESPGLLNFHYDGKEEVREGMFFRGIAGGFPMFAIPTSMSGEPLVFKVKAGRLSWTQFNRGTLTGDLGKQFSAYARPKTITYIGDVHVRLVDSRRFSYGVSQNPATLSDAEAKYKALFDKYPKQVYLLKSPAPAGAADKPAAPAN